MKKIFYFFITTLIAAGFSSCGDDEWADGDPAMTNVFYFAFQNWGEESSSTFNKNAVTYDVEQGSTLEIPMQFWCAGSRGFNAKALYYVTSDDLTVGTDFQVVDANGTSLQPDAKGAYIMEWDLSTDGNNNHRIQNICIKALAGKTGQLTVTTFDPGDVDAEGKLRIDNGNNTEDGKPYTPNFMDDSRYEVHCITTNYKVAVNIK